MESLLAPLAFAMFIAAHALAIVLQQQGLEDESHSLLEQRSTLRLERPRAAAPVAPAGCGCLTAGD